MHRSSFDFTLTVAPEEEGQRLDRLIASHRKDLARSYIARLIRSGSITVSNHAKKPSYSVKTGDRISVKLPAPKPSENLPESIPLDVLYEDAHLIAINKKPGMVVHPAPGHSGGTLVNAILHHCPDIQAIAGDLRPGIVHRLDKDTSGVMVIAKNSHSLQELASQFKSRTVHKFYHTIVFGCVVEDSGSIDYSIGRHPKHRKKMSIHSRAGRPALTHFHVLERFEHFTYLRLKLKTGRTHQIRVHFAAIGHPVMGDDLYGTSLNRGHLFRAGELSILKRLVKRQMLHAHQLNVTHPEDGSELQFTAPLPDDMHAVLGQLRCMAKS